MLQQRWGHSVIMEPAPKLVKEVGHRSAGIGYRVQRMITWERYCLTALNPSSVVFLDRTLDEDMEVFFKLYRAMGELTDDELNRLSHRWFMCDMRARATHYCVLSTSLREAEARLSARPHTPPWLLETLPLQIELYDQWLRELKIPHAVMDVSAASADRVVDWVVEIAERVCEGAGPPEAQFE